jgi:uncharacterized protein (TIGR02271 family)
MELKHALRPGMQVIGSDNQAYGEIERHDDTAVYVRGQPIPFSAIERLDQDHLYVRTTALDRSADDGATPEGEGAGYADFGAATRVPILEEQLEVGARVIDIGEILVHKTVDEVEEVHRGPLSREEVQVERIRVDRPVDEPEQRRQEGDWLVIPIMEEVFVVKKQLLVTEEIRIRKELVTEEHEVRETIRRERASIEDTRPAQPPASTRVTAGGHDDDDNADTGWEALHEQVQRGGR